MRAVHVKLLIAVLATVFALAANDAEAIANEVSTDPSSGSLTLRLSCDARYLSHSPKNVTRTVRVRLMTSAQCVPSTSTKFDDPRIVRIETVASSSGVSLIVDFHEPATFLISQGGDPRVLAILPRMEAPHPTEVVDADVGERDAAIEQAMSEARALLLSGEYDKGIDAYAEILDGSNARYHPEASEYIAIAHQKAGRLEQAIVDYRAWLERYPEHPSRGRVQQRLDSVAVPARAVRAVSEDGRGRWQVLGGVSQDIWEGAISAPLTAEVATYRSLITYVDTLVRHRGQRFDVQARLDAGYQYDLEEGGENSLLVSGAYVSIDDPQTRISARVDRQTLYRDGILGRFDGAHATYRVDDNVYASASIGIPVDTPRYAGDSDRQFVGGGLAFENIAGILDASVYGQLQEIDGVADRQAVGAQLRVARGKLHLYGTVDYDVSYGVLNNGLFQANYRFSDRFAVRIRGQAYAMPFLTTRNAMIGQPVSTIDALLDAYSEGQLRTLARHRTSDVVEGEVGFSAALARRWSVDAATSYIDVDGSIASAGVAAVPAQQEFNSRMNLVGSSIFLPGDALILGYRLRSHKDADVNSAIVDLRIPFGDAWRINPRLAVAHTKGVEANRLAVQPQIRITFNRSRRYKLAFEAGMRDQTYELPGLLIGTPLYPFREESTIERFVSLQWRVDF